MNVISIIIPVHNHAMTILKCLSSVCEQEYTQSLFNIEVIVVMDRCTSETENVIKDFSAHHSQIRYVTLDKVGVNAARNRGVSYAKGEIVLFLDDDCYLPDKKWLMRVYEKFQAFPDAGAVGGGYMLSGMDNIYNVCQNELTAFYIDTHLLGHHESGVLLGGNTAYRKTVFCDIGNFDEHLVWGSDETDFNDRLLMNDKKLYFFEDISVYHTCIHKNHLLDFLVKYFNEGKGRAYSLIKNGVLEKNRNAQKVRWWFWRIALRINAGMVQKIKVEITLFVYALWYWAGYLYGLMYYKYFFRKRTVLYGIE